MIKNMSIGSQIRKKEKKTYSKLFQTLKGD
jgi:hypothetical protein